MQGTLKVQVGNKVLLVESITDRMSYVRTCDPEQSTSGIDAAPTRRDADHASRLRLYITPAILLSWLRRAY